jgi:acetate kinase
MAALLASRSGLAGICGGSGDLRDLCEAASRGDARSQLALDVFVYAIRHYLGAFLVSLGGVDAITFSGGIGENSSEIRRAVLKDLSSFGIQLDEHKNQSIAGEGIISTDHSAVRVMVIPANEEMIVARETAAIVSQSQIATSNAAQPVILAETIQG